MLTEYMKKNDNAEDPQMKQVGKGRARVAENAGESASASSMARQQQQRGVNTWVLPVAGVRPSTTHVIASDPLREVVSPFYM